MKKHLLNSISASFLLISSVSFAQTTLTASLINPVIGENFTLNNGTYVSPGSSGVSQTWDLSTMTGSSAGITNVVTPASTTFGSSFPTATVAENNATAGTVNYFKTSSTALQNVGIASGTTKIPYSDPEDFLHFPFAYTNTFSDTWAAQFVSGGYTYFRSGTTTVTADGWGTLITPLGTFNNVMRVHFVQDYQDSLYIGVPYVMNYYNDEYMWYRNYTHAQLAAVYTLTTPSGSNAGGLYLSSPVGINDMNDMISEYTISPNPTSDLVKLDYTLTENKKTEVKIFNSLGQIVLNQMNENTVQGLNTQELNVATLPEGIYFAEILLEGKVAVTKRFVVSK